MQLCTVGMLKSTLARTSIYVIRFVTFYPEAHEGMSFKLEKHYLILFLDTNAIIDEIVHILPIIIIFFSFSPQKQSAIGCAKNWLSICVPVQVLVIDS